MPNFFYFPTLTIVKSSYSGIIHNDEYSKQQDLYIQNKDNKMMADRALGKMYEITKEAAYNYIKKYCQQRGLYHLDIDEKSHEAAIFVIEQYLKKPEFKVEKISAYVYFGIQKALFKNKDIEMNEVSYDELIERKEYKNK
jgi:hypothetical protein